MAVDFKKRRNVAAEREHAEQLERLDALRSLQRGWDSYEAEPPSETATDNARRVLEALWEEDAEARTRLSPSVEGGVAIVFTGSEGKYADIECFNDGEILAITSEGAAEPSVWPVGADAVSLRDAVVRILAFVHG
jgi:hypothetical protein